jgi:hypothetical protein
MKKIVVLLVLIVLAFNVNAQDGFLIMNSDGSYYLSNRPANREITVELGRGVLKYQDYFSKAINHPNEIIEIEKDSSMQMIGAFRTLNRYYGEGISYHSSVSRIGLVITSGGRVNLSFLLIFVFISLLFVIFSNINYKYDLLRINSRDRTKNLPNLVSHITV